MTSIFPLTKNNDFLHFNFSILDELSFIIFVFSNICSYFIQTWDSALFWLNAVVVPLLGCVGFVFNIFGILTLSYMGITSSSTMYMLIICIGDIISGFVDSILTVGSVVVFLILISKIISLPMLGFDKFFKIKKN